MPWWFYVLIGNFLLALALLLDKAVLGEPEVDPRRYTMLTGLTGVFGVLLVPLGFIGGTVFRIVVPGFPAFVIASCSTFAFFLGLYLFYVAVQKSEASRIGPIVASLSAVFTVLLAAFAVGERFDAYRIVGIVLLLMGAWVLSLRHTLVKDVGANVWPLLIAGFCFAFSAIMLKQLFFLVPFLTGQLLVAGNTVCVGLALLATAPHKGMDSLGAVLTTQFRASRGTFLLFAMSKTAGAGGGLLINFAISIASVALVNASAGVQYAFLFLLSIVLSFFWPRLVHEDISRKTLVAKLTGVALVGAGLALVAHIV